MPSCGGSHILHCISHNNTEDRRTIFIVTLFVFHKFTTNGTPHNQRCVAFSWLSVKQLRDLNSDIHAASCISARMYRTCTSTLQKLIAVMGWFAKMSLVTISIVPPNCCKCMLMKFSINLHSAHNVEVDYFRSCKDRGINQTSSLLQEAIILADPKLRHLNFDPNFSVPSKTFENLPATVKES